MPTTQDVLRAFDYFGDSVLQVQALQLRLESMGFAADAVVSAINEAVTSGHLQLSPLGEIRRS